MTWMRCSRSLRTLRVSTTRLTGVIEMSRPLAIGSPGLLTGGSGRAQYWIVRRREDEQTIGVGGVQRQVTGNWNLYYRLATHAWGHGYAVELARAGLGAGHARDSSVAVVAWVLEHHVSSRRVAERAGLRDYGAHVDPSDGTVRLAFADRDIDVS